MSEASGNRLVFRHELKYLIRHQEMEQLKIRLGGLLQRDSNATPKGYYRIRSLYFDDYWNSAYEDKMMGVGNRHKYRIRYYPDGDKNIHLEKKIKQGNTVAKQTARLSADETLRIINGDYSFLLTRDEALCQTFYYDCTTMLQRPRVVIDYEREAFVFAAGDVRITFDTNVRAGIWSYDLFDDDLPMLNALDPGWLIMEVKYTELMPGFIRSALPTRSGQQMAVSKYVLACDKTMYAAR